MLLRHTAIYFLARGLPGLIGFLSVVVYTRLLAPEAYGRYALTYTAAAVAAGVLFWWLGAGVGRFLPANLHRSLSVLSTALACFAVVASVTVLAGIAVVLSIPGADLSRLAGFAIALVPLLAWYELNLNLAQNQLSPSRYALLGIVRTGLALGLGVVLISYLGFESDGPLLGIGIGALASVILVARSAWRGVSFRLIDPVLVREMLRFGLPLAATFTLSLVVGYSDRFIISAMLGIEQAGLYAAAFDLAQQSIGPLLGIVALAGYPHIMRSMEQHGVAAVGVLLERYALVLFSLAIPAAVGMVCLSGNFAHVFLGMNFRNAGTAVIPWIAVAAAIAGVTGLYFGLAFHLGRRTLPLLWIALATALLNVGATIWLVPILGAVGAAYAAVLAHTFAAVASIVMGRRVFALPSVVRDVFKIVFMSGGMAMVLSLVSDYRGFWALVFQVGAGVATVVVSLLVLDIGNVRSTVRAVLIARDSGAA